MANDVLPDDVLPDDVLPDPDSEFGARVRRRLRDERVIWLTTVDAAGTPQPNPIWFWWEDGELLIYSRPTAYRLRHLAARPRVSLHFNSDGGGDIVVLAGTGRRSPDGPPADAHAGYAEKYRDGMVQVRGSAAGFAADYSVAVRVRLDKVRGF